MEGNQNFNEEAKNPPEIEEALPIPEIPPEQMHREKEFDPSQLGTPDGPGIRQLIDKLKEEDR